MIARFTGLIAAFGLCAALVPGAAGAASPNSPQTATLTVNGSVVQNCTITAGTLNFAAYDPVSANLTAADTGSGTFTVTCPKGSTGVDIVANQGANHGSGGCATTRAMKSGSNFLCYELYTEGTFTDVWNTTTNGTNDFEPTFTSGHSAVTETVFGSIPGAQDATAGGGYTDSVTMTLTF